LGLSIDWKRVLDSSVVRTTLLILCASGSVGCGGDEAAPVTAARRFADAVQNRDVVTMLPLVDSGARDLLQRAAERASDQVGGRRNIEPHEMLQVVDVDPRFQVARAELVHGDDDTAQVKLVGADGTDHLLDLVYEEGAWRVRIVVPAVPLPGES
jgi:hypothetical protein